MSAKKINALRLVSQTALEWTEEYGFVNPARAREIIKAVYLVDPDALSGDNLEWAEQQADAEPKAGDRFINGDEPGVLITCEACSGEGTLHVPDKMPEPVAPTPEKPQDKHKHDRNVHYIDDYEVPRYVDGCPITKADLILLQK